ncbi:hypothetical protein GCM10010429_30030 [Micromonospora olivasterospora]
MLVSWYNNGSFARDTLIPVNPSKACIELSLSSRVGTAAANAQRSFPAPKQRQPVRISSRADRHPAPDHLAGAVTESGDPLAPKAGREPFGIRRVSACAASWVDAASAATSTWCSKAN